METLKAGDWCKFPSPESRCTAIEAAINAGLTMCHSIKEYRASPLDFEIYPILFIREDDGNLDATMGGYLHFGEGLEPSDFIARILAIGKDAENQDEQSREFWINRSRILNNQLAAASEEVRMLQHERTYPVEALKISLPRITSKQRNIYNVCRAREIVNESNPPTKS